MKEGYPDPESPAGELEAAIFAIVRWSNSREVQAETMRRARCNLPLSVVTLLFRIGACGPVRPSRLATYYGVDNSTITPRLQRLEREGLIARRADPVDGRAFFVQITSSGEKLCRRMRAARRGLLELLLADWPLGEQGRVASAARELAARLETQFDQVAEVAV